MAEEEEKKKGVVTVILLAKFKDTVSQSKIDELIRGYAALGDVIEQVKGFQWGKDVSVENLNQGYTHVFESKFESTEDVEEYVAHPAHVAYAKELFENLDQVLVVYYSPTPIPQIRTASCF